MSHVPPSFDRRRDDSEYAIIGTVVARRLLRESRRRAGLTQRELARRTNVAQPTIARIESGQADPRVATLERLLAACGQTLDATARRGEGVDRSQIRALLRVSPRRRLELLRKDAAGLERLDRTRRR